MNNNIEKFKKILEEGERKQRRLCIKARYEESKEIIYLFFDCQFFGAGSLESVLRKNNWFAWKTPYGYEKGGCDLPSLSLKRIQKEEWIPIGIRWE